MRVRLLLVWSSSMLILALMGQSRLRAEAALTIDDVMQKAVSRGQQDQQGTVPDFAYRKTTITEQLDGSGKVKERREKLYEVSYRDGLSHSTLLQVDGHPPSDSDLKQLSDNESSVRQLTGETKRAGDNRENFLTAELVARFDFTLVAVTNVNGRAAYQVSFTPKSPRPPVHRMVDRLLNQLSGTIWIDAEEFEVARAEVTLQAEVNLLGGLVGSIKKLNYTLERTRVAEGVWFSTLANGDFQGRKLLDPTHIKTKSQSVHFHRLAMSEDGARFAEN